MRVGPQGSTVLCMLPDTGERYLSTPMFEDIPEEMTEEETAISRSTPGYRFDVRPAQAAVPEARHRPVEIPEKAAAFLDQAINDPANPVVVFALEWCEFCWSVRKMFARYEIPYRCIALDSVAYQAGDWGGQIRLALNERFSVKTIPQVFVGGTLVGGATEVFDAQKSGALAGLLAANGVVHNEAVDVDPYSFLPAWLQPR